MKRFALLVALVAVVFGTAVFSSNNQVRVVGTHFDTLTYRATANDHADSVSFEIDSFFLAELDGFNALKATITMTLVASPDDSDGGTLLIDTFWLGLHASYNGTCAYVVHDSTKDDADSTRTQTTLIRDTVGDTLLFYDDLYLWYHVCDSTADTLHMGEEAVIRIDYDVLLRRK